MVLLKKQKMILNDKLPYLINQKQDFGKINKSEQTKYLAYFFVRITRQNIFNTEDISPLFTLVGVSQPENVRDILNKLRERSILIYTGTGFSFHRDIFSELNQEFGSLSVQNRGSEGLSELRVRKIHPEIIDASEKLFMDGHYSEAIFNAFKRIEILVKRKSGIINLTGHPLMQKVFSVTTSLLKFNNLLTHTDKDEQLGMMELFSGAMLGIRNPKAHEDIIQKDSIKTLEYLAFASLLCKRLDDTKTS